MGSMTHWDGCWKSGRDHYGCALARLEREVKRREAAEALLPFLTYGPWSKANQAAYDAWQQLVKEAGDA